MLSYIPAEITYNEDIFISKMKPFKLQYPSANYIIQKTEIEPDIQMIDFDDEKKMLSVSP